MAIKNSNATDPSLKLGGDIQTEFGGNNPVSISEYYSGAGLVALGTVGEFGAIPASGAISFSDFYGSISDALPQGTPGIVLSGTTDIVSNVALGDTLRVKVDNITDDNNIVADSWLVRWYLDGQLNTLYSGPYSVLQDGTLPFDYSVNSNTQFEKNIYAEVRFKDENNNTYVLQSNTVFVGENAQPGENGVTISGGNTNGSTLTANAVFTDGLGNPAASTTYTWLRSSNNTLDFVNDTIVKLNSDPNPSQYEITPNDIGSYLFCFVVFTDGIGDIFTASASVQAINDPATGSVTLATQPAGSAAVPEVTLRATANISDDDGIASYEFNFRRESNPTVNIQQTTVTPPSNTADYTTTQADDGERIFVVMDVTDNAIVPNTRRATSNSILISQGTSYSVAADASSVTEGGSVTFTVTVSNAQAETLNWSVTGTAVDSGRASASGGATSGTIAVAATPSVQTFDITINTASSNQYVGPEAFRLRVTGASAPDALSGNVTLNDATFTASVTTPSAVNEGTAISVSATATNLPDTNWDVRIKTVNGGSFASVNTPPYNLIFAWNQQLDQYVAIASIPTTEDATEFIGGSIVLEIRNTADFVFTERTVTINNITVQPPTLAQYTIELVPPTSGIFWEGTDLVFDITRTSGTGVTTAYWDAVKPTVLTSTDPQFDGPGDTRIDPNDGLVTFQAGETVKRVSVPIVVDPDAGFGARNIIRVYNDSGFTNLTDSSGNFIIGERSFTLAAIPDEILATSPYTGGSKVAGVVLYGADFLTFYNEGDISRTAVNQQSTSAFPGTKLGEWRYPQFTDLDISVDITQTSSNGSGTVSGLGNDQAIGDNPSVTLAFTGSANGGEATATVVITMKDNTYPEELFETKTVNLRVEIDPSL